MAKELEIIIGAKYTIKGDIFQLVGIRGDYFTLQPLKVNNVYQTSADGLITMRALVFAGAKKYVE